MTKARVNADNASADIQGVTAGTGLTGGGTSGTVTLTNDMATVIDAKGDLVVGTGADTYDNLAAGSNGDTLVADSSTSTGLRYTGNFAAGKNSVLNSDYSTWQRGTTFTSVANVGYTADRWCIFTGSVSGRDVSRQATNDTTNLPFIKYAARVGRASGNTNTTNFFIGQSYESVNSTELAGKTVTISYYARAGANYSSASNVLNVYAAWGTGTDQNIFAGFTGQTSLGGSNGTLTTTWQRFTTTGTLGATATQFGLYFGYTPSGTAGAADYFEITGVQVEIGSVATAFQTATGTIQGELAACQRYYIRYKSEDGSTNNPTLNLGQMVSTSAFRFVLPFPTAMRVKPSAVEYSGFRLNSGATQYTSGAITIDQANTLNTQLNVVITSGPAAGTAGWLIAGSGSSTDYLGLSAEL
jgi:ribosomal protein L27